MSWLSEFWRRIKGGRTDAEVIFEAVVSRLSAKQRNELTEAMRAILRCVDEARDQQAAYVQVARQWVGGALMILEARK